MICGTLPPLKAEVGGAVVTETERGSCWGSSNSVWTYKGGVLWVCGRKARGGGVGSIGSILGSTADWGIRGRGRMFKENRGKSALTNGRCDGPGLSGRLVSGPRWYPIANGSDIRRVAE